MIKFIFKNNQSIVTKRWHILPLVICMMLIIQSIGFSGEQVDNFYIEYNGQTYQYNSKTVTVVINGHTIETGDMPALVIDQRTLVPAREVFESEAMGAVVTWNGENQEISIVYQDKFIVLRIGSNVAYVNGNTVEMDVPPMLIKEVSQSYSKTMIPLRFVTENFGFDVTWDGDTWTAFAENDDAVVESPDEPVPEGEQLDSIQGGQANSGLPTALANAPLSIIPDAATDQTQFEPVGVEMTDEDHDTVPFTDFMYHATTNGGYFEIIAEGPISSIASMSYWDQKLILKVVNGSFGYDTLSGTYTHEFEENPYVTSIRSSQQENDDYGRKILSLVFDLKTDAENYEIRISEDRNSLYVGQVGQMLQADVTNTLDSILLHQNEYGDYIDVHYGVEPEVDVFRLSGPDRIVFDLGDTVTKLGTRGYTGLQGQYITALRTAQFGINDPTDEDQNEDISRLVVETDGQADYQLIKIDDHTLRIQFTEPGYENIVYEKDEDDNPTITLEDVDDNLEVSQITYEDNYRDHEYIITLPGSYDENFGEGILNINDGLIESVDIYEDEYGNTKIKIIEREIHVFTVEKEGANITIKAYKPSQVYSQVMVVDIGHGGKDPGAIIDDIEEADLNLDIGLKLKALLDQRPDIKVYYTRLDDTYLTLQERVDIANQVDADFFVSIHNNSYVSSIHGTETFYFKDEPRPGLNAYELAEYIHDNVIATTGQYDRRDKEHNTLYVLRHTTMPACLVECGFMSNEGDMSRLMDDGFRQNIAQGIFNGIVQTYSAFPTDRTPVVALPVVAEPIPVSE